MKMVIEWHSTLPTLSARAEQDLKEAIQRLNLDLEYLGKVVKAELSDDSTLVNG